jgi:hypothetical protein
VSSTPDDDAPAPAAQDGAGVLSQLPRTRPQRASARRAAARESRAPAPATPESAAGQTAAPERKSRPKSTSKRATAAKRPRAGEGAAAKPKPSASKRTGAAPKSAAPGRERRTASGASARAREEEVPSQGFATEGERVSGPVAPPGGPELFATAAEIVSELARAGVSTGERVVRDVLSRLPLG